MPAGATGCQPRAGSSLRWVCSCLPAVRIDLAPSPTLCYIPVPSESPDGVEGGVHVAQRLDSNPRFARRCRLGLGPGYLALSLAEGPGLALSRRAIDDGIGNADRWQDREYDEERRRQALASAGRRCRGRGDLAIVPG